MKFILTDFLYQLMSDMPLDPRVEFHRVTVKASQDGLKAYSTGGQRSSRVASLSGANAFVVLPSRSANSPARLNAGTVAEAVIIGEIKWPHDKDIRVYIKPGHKIQDCS